MKMNTISARPSCTHKNKFLSGRKAQLTIFIIIGIVLLFSTALVVYIKQSITEYKPPIEIAFEQVPAEMQPLQRYITDCLESTAKDALRKLGMQGGYVDTSNLIVNDADPTSANAISFPPNGDVKVPYWYYMQSPNNCGSLCEFDTKKPELYRTAVQKGNSIEEQIDKYVEQKLSSCLRGFYTFKQQGFEIEESNIKAYTTIAKTDVFVQVDYPLKVKKAGVIHELSKFTAQIPINLGKLYDLAADLTRKQISTHYLDLFAMNLIDVYSGVDENKLPPVADTTFFKGKTKQWMHSNVKDDIEELLMMYSPALQTTGASNFQGNLYKGDDPMAAGLYSLFILPLDKTYTANTEFTYLKWWPSYLKITPSDGELIKPESASGFDDIISFLGINQYQFAYDVSYPVLITLSDPDALDGDGFIFQFALESNIRNNAYMEETVTLISYSGRARSTMVCNPENFKSGNITVDVSDSITKEPAANALVYFSFGRESCLIGETVPENGKAIMNSKMPVGIGALVVSKDDYISKTIQFGTRLGAEQEVEIELDRIVDVDVSVARIPAVKVCSSPDGNVICSASKYDPGSQIPILEQINKLNPLKFVETLVREKVKDVCKGKQGTCLWGPVNTKVPGLAETQRITLSFMRIPENDAEEEFISSVEIRGDDTAKQQVRLAPGNYQLVGNLIDYRKTIIPEDELCYDDDVYDSWGLGKQKCRKIDAVAFEMFPKGGVSIDSFEITGNDMKDAKEVQVYLFETPSGYAIDADGVTDLTHDDLKQIGKSAEYSQNYIEWARPVFIKSK